MTTAIDTSVLLDLVTPASRRVDAAEDSLRRWGAAGPLIVSEPVYAETAGSADDRAQFESFISGLGLRLLPSSPEALFLAGTAWFEYRSARPRGLVCPSCGASNPVVCGNCGRAIESRQHIVADFLIGAHAQVHAQRLLTRDRGFYRRYFSGLEVVAPA